MENNNSTYKANRYIYIRHLNEWIDITNRKAIIFGAGQGCFKMLNTLELPNIEKVIDSNKILHGTKILIHNKLFMVETPEILKNINLDEYYIVISSTMYSIEMIQSIRKIISNDNVLVGVWDNDIRYCYNKIEDMLFMDPIIKSKLVRLGLSFDTYNILNRFNEIRKKYFQKINIDIFVPIQKGYSKLVFIFGNKSGTWVYSQRGKISSLNKMEIFKNEENLFVRNYTFMKKNDLDREITLYRDEDGVVIQKYAKNQICCSDIEIRKQIMRECRRIHEMDACGLAKNRMIIDSCEYFKSQVLDKKKVKDISIIERIFKLMDNNLNILNSSNEKKVIHGDLNLDNIVVFEGKVFFIDWEFLSVGHPMYDVVYFLFRTNYTGYLKNRISFYELCEICFEELPNILREYCLEEYEISAYQEISEAILKLFFIRYSLEIYLINEKKGRMQFIEFLRFLKEE